MSSQIFVLSDQSTENVQQLCDADLNWACYGYAKILSDVHHVVDGAHGRKLRTDIYPPSDIHSDAVKWAAEFSNYAWLYSIMKEAWEEYHIRKDKWHASMRMGLALAKAPDGIRAEFSTWTCPPQQVPDKYRKLPKMVFGQARALSDNKWLLAIAAYRDYYIHEKSKVAHWTKRTPPQWYTDGVANLPKIVSPTSPVTPQPVLPKTVPTKTKSIDDYLLGDSDKPKRKPKPEPPDPSTLPSYLRKRTRFKKIAD